jgi:dihydroorotase
MSLLIKKINIIDPEKKFSGFFDILIEEEKIKEISKDISAPGAEVFDGASLSVCPGFIDIHCHLRDPGLTHKEDLESGGKAALAGGFTTLCPIANTKPVIDNAKLALDLINRGKKLAGPTILPFGAISKGLSGDESADFKELCEAGCVAISDDGIYLKNRAILKKAFEFSKKEGVTVALHEEDLSYGAGSRKSEIESIRSDLELFSQTGGKLHIQHVSLKESCELVEEAQKNGLNVTCEVTPHHLCLTEADFQIIGNDAKCSPPLRTQEDVDYLVDALNRGVISAVATDHAPHTAEEKKGLNQEAPNGILGFQTAFLVLLELVENGKLTLERAVESLTISPAKIMGLHNVGKIRVGGDANLVIFDQEQKAKFTEGEILSKSINSPFIGKEFKGRVRATIHAGHIKYISK